MCFHTLAAALTSCTLLPPSNTGETGFFPQGLLHLQQNTAATVTVAIQHFSSANPGVQRIIPATFAGESDEVSAGFNNFLSVAQVDLIRTKLVKGFPKKP